MVNFVIGEFHLNKTMIEDITQVTVKETDLLWFW